MPTNSQSSGAKSPFVLRPNVRSSCGVLGFAALLAAVVQLVGCRDVESAGPEATRLAVNVLTVAETDHYIIARKYIGEVVASESSEMGFELAGRVTRVLVDEGDTVEAGDALAHLDTELLMVEQSRLQAQHDEASAVLKELQAGPRKETIENTRAVVRELAALHEEAERHKNRILQLRRANTSSDGEYEKALFAETAAAARLAAAKSKLEELEAGTRQEKIDAQIARVKAMDAALREVATRIRKSTLFAPYSGKIATRRVEQGDAVLPGEAVVRLVRTDKLEAAINIPVENVGAVTASGSQYLEVAGVFHAATLRAVLPEVNQRTRTVTAVFRFDRQPRLFVGQLARLTMGQRVEAKGVWLPTSALVKGIRGLWSCFVVTENDRGGHEVQRRDIEVLHVEIDRVFVRGAIRSGERVVRDGVERIVPGQLVKTAQNQIAQASNLAPRLRL